MNVMQLGQGTNFVPETKPFPRIRGVTRGQMVPQHVPPEVPTTCVP